MSDMKLFEIDDSKIKLNRDLTKLDKFVISFLKLLNNLNINYVVVSGYVSILFWRTRMTEDVDILIEKIGFNKFKTLLSMISNSFWCLNPGDEEELFDMLKSGHSIRFAEKESVIPKIELRFAESKLDRYALSKCVDVVLKGEVIKVSPIELQVVYKLYLGSNKDIEDARYLYKLFAEHISNRKLKEFVDTLKVKDKVKYLE
jgi:hypothetical protein